MQYINENLDINGAIELQLILVNEEKKFETPKELKATKRLKHKAFGRLFDGNLSNDEIITEILKKFINPKNNNYWLK